MTNAAPDNDAHPLDALFYPRSVAIVGISSDYGASRSARSGFLSSMLELGFHEERELYLVNPKADEIAGLKCYPSLLDCPGPVDHVISSIPARAVPQLVDQCVEKGVRSLHFFTAGFSETGDPAMAALEREVIAKAVAGGVRVIGPNCMGLYVPETRISFHEHSPRETGEVMVISQSGANASDIIDGLGERGVRFSKVVSFGNGADLDAHDFFDYAAWDPKTAIVVAYIEGVRQGRRFFDAVRRCAAQKPTVILKGGLTAAGARAANSHTGSLAGSLEVFEALCRQTGAWRAETMEELQDLVVALSTRLRGVRGPGAVLMGGGGGFSVLSADAIAREGLDLPPMPRSAVEALREFVPVAGTSVNNPIDAGFLGREGREHQRRAMEIVARVESVDVVLQSGLGGLGQTLDTDPTLADRSLRRAMSTLETMAEVQEETGVPFVSVHRGRGPAPEETTEFRTEALRCGVAAFPSVARAARTVAILLGWRARREGLPAIL